ncbi:MAG TPA: hypothetical protein VNQ79_15895 [Blastocatellia bacterium]|nr:hypothetical protein [Blastocatellia bacterium]
MDKSALQSDPRIRAWLAGRGIPSDDERHGIEVLTRNSGCAPVVLQSGRRALLRRVDWQLWLIWGRLPQFFTSLVAQAQREKLSKEEAEQRAAQMERQMSDDEKMNALLFQRDVVKHSFVLPRLEFDGQPPFSLDPMDLSVDEFNEVFLWQCNGAPDVAIRMREGEVTVDAVRRFRDGGRGQLPADAGRNVPEFRSEAERRTRHRRKKRRR